MEGEGLTIGQGPGRIRVSEDSRVYYFNYSGSMGLLELTTGRVGLIGTVEQGTREEEVKNITEGASTNGGRRCTEPL